MSAVTRLRLTSCLRLGLDKQLTSGARCQRSVPYLCTAFSKSPEVRPSSHVLGRGLEDFISGPHRFLSLSAHWHAVDTNGSKKNQTEPEVPKDDKEPAQKLTMVQKLKTMFKEYWYVLLPVHLSTSVIWIGSLYYAAKSGMDIVPLLEYVGASEVILKPLRNTGAGYWAVTYALYKLIGPARYAVTLGGTTIAINYLKRWGLIKPMPTSGQMKTMFEQQRTQFRTRRAEGKSEAQDANIKSSSTTTLKSESSKT